ncbi:acyl transferase/acyl hydrolase/lysophospholipase [Rhodocollybia butyracea]|uniref:Acyl transferase/acyl hydrolase/lysophospholipase n=1 Tax=Rhodocollybia butyracea TaxID=206335 RepID=A0A9P5TXQ6_9AGAR|nr:acyl transferase/acyl hydrolase/lysophospholipase [Rhodocollybia butyracea]
MQRDRRILSIDGSGFRALTQLGLLEYLMDQVNKGHPPGVADKCPADVFDLICGTAAGGLLAILLGRLGMSCEDARKTYLELERKLFTKGTQKSDGTWDVLRTSTAKFGTKDFQDELKRVVEERLGEEDALMLSDKPTKNQQKSCRTLVTVMRSDRLTGADKLTDAEKNKAYADGDNDALRIRSYKLPVRPGDQSDSSVAPAPTWTVWQAAIGTTACPTMFSPVDMISENPSSSGLFQAASGSGFANPSMIAYVEALDLFGTRSDPPPLTLVSLGMGIRNRHDYETSNDAIDQRHVINQQAWKLREGILGDSKGSKGDAKINEDRVKAFLRQTQLVAVATQIKHLRVSALIQRSGSSQRYFRFDPSRDNRDFVIVDFAQQQLVEGMVTSCTRTQDAGLRKSWTDATRQIRGTWAWQWVELRNHTNGCEDNRVNELTETGQTESTSAALDEIALDMVDKCHRWETRSQNTSKEHITCFTIILDEDKKWSSEMFTGRVDPEYLPPPDFRSLKRSRLYVRVLLEDTDMRFYSQRASRNFTDTAEPDSDGSDPQSPVEAIRRWNLPGVTGFNSAGWSTRSGVDLNDLFRDYQRFHYPHEGTWVKVKKVVN